MIRTAMVGLGKMGLSHLAIVRAHPEVNLVAGCDATAYLTDILSKHAGLKCYADFDRMLASEQLDALVIATPSKLHAGMVEKALERGLNVFCEKPFVLDVSDGERLVALAESKALVNQVGFYPLSLRPAPSRRRRGSCAAEPSARSTTCVPKPMARSYCARRARPGVRRRSEGGGALYDSACHAIDLVNFIAGVPDAVAGVARHGIFSRDVDDEVYATFYYPGGASGQLSVNWSDESFRKMSTKISVWGTNGRITADRQECQIFLREPHAAVESPGKGWTVRYTTDLSEEVWYYLRGEEYSAQIDYFVKSIQTHRTTGENTFRSALDADRVVAMILADAGPDTARPREGIAAPRKQASKGPSCPTVQLRT